MTLRNVQVGDRIEAKVKGRRFEAIVEELHNEDCFAHPVKVKPVTGGITYRYLTAREVVRVIERPSTQMELVA